MLYRVNPFMLMYSALIDGMRKYIIETSAFDPPLIVKDWRFAWAISLLPEKFTRDEVLEIWAQDPYTDELREEIWAITIQSKLIVLCDESSPEYHRFDIWQAYGWAEASTYQEATRDYPFVKMDEPGAFAIDDARMVKYLSQSDIPSLYQRLPSKFIIPLRKLEDGESANELLNSMTPTQRRGMDGLSLLFDVCFGERAKVKFNIQGSFLRKSIPSGGARHPTEIFFTAFPEWCIPPGVYHYNVESHSLHCIQPGNFFKEFEFATFDLFKKFKKKPIGLLAFTSLYERAMWRYRDPRSWRAVLIDVGHALMIFRTVLEALGYGSYTYQKVRDKELCHLLKVNPIRQSPLYVGTLV